MTEANQNHDADEGRRSTEQLGPLVNRALFADECQRLAEWALIGPVQRAALESFAERLLAAERERWKSRCAGKSHYGCQYLATCGSVCNKCGTAV
jgi:hypothetical protein